MRYIVQLLWCLINRQFKEFPNNSIKKRGKQMKKMSLRAKMLLCILPIMAIAMVLLTYVAANQLSASIQTATTDTMNQTVIANANIVDGKLNIIKTSCVDIAQMISTSYRFVTMDNYKGTITKIITNNDTVLGSGIWFEPYMFDEKEMYMGPYWYKDGGQIVETYDYSNAEYDYFNQEYYLNLLAYNPLFMVKDFNSKVFSTDNSFMTNADTPLQAFGGLIEKPVNPFLNTSITDEQKHEDEQHVLYRDWSTADDSSKYSFEDVDESRSPKRWLTLRNANIFDLNNWTVEQN